MKYVPVAVAILLAVLCRLYLISVLKVTSQTMAPSVLTGDYIVASQLNKHPKAGELTVFVKNSRTYIKRVIAVENDEVEYKDGEFLINSIKCAYEPDNEVFDNLYAAFTEKCGDQQRKVLRPVDLAKNSMNLAKIRVAAGELFVVGDNRNFENNLTNAEIIHFDQIVGKPLTVWMSYASTQDFISKTLGFRWNRILTNIH